MVCVFVYVGLAGEGAFATCTCGALSQGWRRDGGAGTGGAVTHRLNLDGVGKPAESGAADNHDAGLDVGLGLDIVGNLNIVVVARRPGMLRMLGAVDTCPLGGHLRGRRLVGVGLGEEELDKNMAQTGSQMR